MDEGQKKREIVIRRTTDFVSLPEVGNKNLWDREMGLFLFLFFKWVKIHTYKENGIKADEASEGKICKTNVFSC